MSTSDGGCPTTPESPTADQPPRSSTTSVHAFPGSNLPHLPLEVVKEIVSHLDANTADGTRALLSCLVVSSELWTSAAKTLYRHVVINEELLARLMIAYRQDDDSVSPRAVKVFSFVKQFTFVGHCNIGVKAVWRLATLVGGGMDKPLFPNVTKVTCRPSATAVYLPYGRYTEGPPEDIRIFGRIDVCYPADMSGTESTHYIKLNRLPTRSIGHMCLHGHLLTVAMVQTIVGALPKSRRTRCKAITFFHPGPRCGKEHVQLMEDMLPWRKRLPPITILFNVTSWLDEAIQVPSDIEVFSWSYPEHDVVKSVRVEDDERDAYPRCSVCDKQWTKRFAKEDPLPYGDWMMDKLQGITPKEEIQTTPPDDLWTKNTWLHRRKLEARRWLDDMRTSLAKA
ncbi:uncharacterized protein LOC62_04G005221 [Vanrija pseudolonga]|uniref:F-box domain-containing protein n=1 Tax=Vanrija pseudolonga TaxID=143232 RepID=A0AAF0Y867_9TREE|nr:hypothetical protein LOC62_04G005221 [Vanrija pseudolonga]